MHFETKKQAKTTVSALRRELKGFTKPASELSHSECLTILAKAFGHKSWNEWEASLLEEEPAAALAKPADVKYPLRNTGQFDFVSKDEDGTPVTGNFDSLAGARELLFGTCSASRAARGSEGLTFQGDGRTEIDWDAQRTDRNAKGETLWFDEDYALLPESALVLLPDEYEGEPLSDYGLPVRAALIGAYKAYFLETGVDLKSLNASRTKSTLYAASKTIGFRLTQHEAEVFLEETQGPTAADGAAPSDEQLEQLAYRQAFNRVFADGGDDSGTRSSISKVMEALSKATLRQQGDDAEALLRRKVSELITLNGPYEGFSVAELASELRALAKTAYERLVLKNRR